MNADLETHRHLEAATGYVGLRMLEDAIAELDMIRPEMAEAKPVMGLRALIYKEVGDWQRLREVCGFMAVTWPEDLDPWILLANSTRRCHSLEEAELVLLKALKFHDSEPTIHFNLACYAAQSGRLDEASVRLKRAIVLDPELRATALDDPDLEPLWERLSEGL